MRIADLARELKTSPTRLINIAKISDILVIERPEPRVSGKDAKTLRELFAQRAAILHSINLTNFKAFSETQFIPIRPLTLIFGPNSAGKSSIVHGLALLHECVKSGRVDIGQTQLGGDSVDLGGFRSYVFGHDVSRQVSWRIELTIPKSPDSILSGRLTVELVVGMPDDSDEDAVPAATLLAFKISDDAGFALSLARTRDEIYRIDAVDLGHPVIQNCIKSAMRVSPVSRRERLAAAQARSLQDFIQGLYITAPRFFPSKVERQVNDRGEPNVDWVQARMAFEIERVLTSFAASFTGMIERLHYLGPLRAYPARGLATTQFADYSPEADGSAAWHALITDTSLREKVNHWLSDPARLQTPYQLLAKEYVEKGLAGKIGTSTTPTYSELVLLDMRTETIVTHRDVGVGISQILPVLVAAYGSTGKVIAIEQPELHLHPALQAELADVFIESALGRGKNFLLVETHSENLILRLLRRIREGRLNGQIEISPDQVAVLCVEPTDGGSVVHEIPVSQNGDFAVPWPTGFFEERRKEWL